MNETRYADETEVRTATLMTPDMANFVGNVHGGHVMMLCDNTAYACASRFAGTAAVTASVDRVDFLAPVHVGELLHIVARVVYVGRTSLELEVTVHAENFVDRVTRHTTSCYFTFVALRDGKPAPVPRLVPRSHGDKVRYLQAKLRREMAASYRTETKGAVSRWDGLTEEDLDALIERDQDERGHPHP